MGLPTAYGLLCSIGLFLLSYVYYAAPTENRHDPPKSLMVAQSNEKWKQFVYPTYIFSINDVGIKRV